MQQRLHFLICMKMGNQLIIKNWGSKCYKWKKKTRSKINLRKRSSQASSQTLHSPVHQSNWVYYEVLPQNQSVSASLVPVIVTHRWANPQFQLKKKSKSLSDNTMSSYIFNFQKQITDPTNWVAFNSYTLFCRVM